MAAMDVPAAQAHRPRVVLAIIGLLVFLGLLVAPMLPAARRYFAISSARP
jgi:hypothetical protein